MKKITSALIFGILCFSAAIQVQAQDMSLKAIVARNAKPVIIPFRDQSTGMYGYKNTKTGKILVPCKYKFANAFSEGLGAVNVGGKTAYDKEYAMDYVCKGGKWGYVDSLGTVVIPVKYDNADDFHDGFSSVEQNKKKALIDASGKILTEFKYEYIYPFSEGLAVVGRGKPLKFTYVDKTGKEILPCDMDEANSFFKGKAKVVRFGATYSINKKGERTR
jgi:hypothetical protein